MKERRSYGLAALGAGLLLLLTLYQPFSGSVVAAFGLWWKGSMAVLCVTSLLTAAGWLLMLPYARMVRFRFAQQPGLWLLAAWGFALVAANSIFLGLTSLAMLVAMRDFSFATMDAMFTVQHVLTALQMVCLVGGLALLAIFFFRLFAYCRRVESRSALTFLPLAAVVLLLIGALTDLVGMLMEQVPAVDHAVSIMRGLFGFIMQLVAVMLLLSYFYVNISKSRS